MLRQPFWGLTVQRGPWKETKIDKAQLREKEVQWRGGGVGAGGTTHSGHGNWYAAINTNEQALKPGSNQELPPSAWALPSVVIGQHSNSGQIRNKGVGKPARNKGRFYTTREIGALGGPAKQIAQDFSYAKTLQDLFDEESAKKKVVDYNDDVKAEVKPDPGAPPALPQGMPPLDAAPGGFIKESHEPVQPDERATDEMANEEHHPTQETQEVYNETMLQAEGGSIQEGETRRAVEIMKGQHRPKKGLHRSNSLPGIKSANAGAGIIEVADLTLTTSHLNGSLGLNVTDDTITQALEYHEKFVLDILTLTLSNPDAVESAGLSTEALLDGLAQAEMVAGTVRMLLARNQIIDLEDDDNDMAVGQHIADEASKLVNIDMELASTINNAVARASRSHSAGVLENAEHLALIQYQRFNSQTSVIRTPGNEYKMQRLTPPRPRRYSHKVRGGKYEELPNTK